MAEDRANLLEINASASNQPCAKFGVHKSLEAVHQLYQDGDALWVANMGKPTWSWSWGLMMCRLPRGACGQQRGLTTRLISASTT